jgi:phospholipid/cholesterol/gamma-HCH transport system ATP-binding protein
MAPEAPPAEPAAVPRTVIRIEGVKVAFGEKVVLDGMDLEVRKSEILVILGGSGAGKSVTLKVMCGLVRPDAGKVTVFKQDVLALEERELRHLRKFGYVFQSGALINWLTAAENVALPLLEHDLCEVAEVEGRAQEALALVGLPEAGPLLPDQLSGGMRKRVALARALVQEPNAILYDEPTTGLDPISTASIDQVIKGTRDRTGLTSVVISHDLDSAFRIADRIAMLYKGRMVACAPTAEFRALKLEPVRRFLEADPGDDQPL